MAILHISKEQRVISKVEEIEAFLKQYGIWYKYFAGCHSLAKDATDDEILAAFAEDIEVLKREHQYTTADVVHVTPNHPQLEVLEEKFRQEHWHDEDEVRFITQGRGIFYIHPKDGPIFSIEVTPGDMINVPRNMLHWFLLGPEKHVRAVRLFQATSGWAPHYTESKLDEAFSYMDTVHHVLLDIEGTTTPIAFVKETLFPYARKQLPTICANPDSVPGAADALALLRNEFAAETPCETLPEQFGNGEAYCEFLMDVDRKSTGLKALQGLLWADGYQSGKIKAPVYEDVVAKMGEWQARGISISIYSSGSIFAQKLLFTHSSHGDLSPHIAHYFDTTSGHKREVVSYHTIAGVVGGTPNHILFLSDVGEELAAAREAGMQTGLLIRPGNLPTNYSGPQYTSFADIPQ